MITNQTVKTSRMSSFRNGKLERRKSVVHRRTGNAETSREIHGIAFTFADPMICSLQDLPLGAVYCIGPDGKAKVTQIVRRFGTDEEQENWVAEVLGLSDAPEEKSKKEPISISGNP